MKFEIRIDVEASEFLNSLDSKTKRIIKENLRKLKEDPYSRPQKRKGDVEKVRINGEEIYRMHISRSFTAFYIIKEEENKVVVTEILDIDKAHKRYD